MMPKPVMVRKLICIFAIIAHGSVLGQTSAEPTPAMDLSEPLVQCPSIILQSAGIFSPATGTGEEDVVCTVFFLNSSDPFPLPGSGCVVHVRDNRFVQSVQIQNTATGDIYTVVDAATGNQQTTTITVENLRNLYNLVVIDFIARDAVGNTATCSVRFNISMTPRDVINTSVFDIDKLMNASFSLSSVPTTEGLVELCQSVENAGTLVGYTNSSFVANIAMSMLRLSRFVHDMELTATLSCRSSLIIAATAISEKRAAIQFVVPAPICGDSVCIISEESCYSCPTDCGVVGSFSSSPCATSVAFVVDDSGTVAYSVPPESPVSTAVSPLVTQSHWGPLPFFFGPVSVRFDAVSSNKIWFRSCQHRMLLKLVYSFKCTVSD